MTTLETRRVRADLIEVFKLFKVFDKVDVNRFFTRNAGVTRGHDLKVFKYGCRLDCRKFYFSNRVAGVWNDLPNNIIACNAISSFKKGLDKFMEGRGYI